MPMKQFSKLNIPVLLPTSGFNCKIMHMFTFGLPVLTFAAIVGTTLAQRSQYRRCTTADCNGRAACATIYQRRNFQGWPYCLTFQNDECTTLNSWWIGSGSRVSSVFSHNTCVRLHEHANCTGYSVEIRPGGANHGNLQVLRFEKEARSVSSCRRPASYNECTAKTLFSRHIEPHPIVNAVSSLVGQANNISAILASGNSNSTQNLNGILESLRVVLGLFDNTNRTVGVLVEGNVTSNIARASAGQVSSRVRYLRNRLGNLLSPLILHHDRRLELRRSVHTCEALRRQFTENRVGFNQTKVGSSPYLVAFSSVCLVLSRSALQVRPDLRVRILRLVSELAALNELYLREAITLRRQQFGWDNYNMGYVIKDNLVCPQRVSSGGHGCLAYNSCRQWYQCERCRSNIRNDIGTRYEQLFRPLITALRSFPN